METFIVTTQYLENYGAHDGSEDKHYWKPKGGATYRVKASREYDAVAIVANRECFANHGFVEYPHSVVTETEFMASLPQDDDEYRSFLLSVVKTIE